MRQVLCHGRLGWRLLEDGLASVVNVRGPRLLAIGESLPQVGKLGVCAVLLDQPRNGVHGATDNSVGGLAWRRLCPNLPTNACSGGWPYWPARRGPIDLGAG
jgi:hypothetical protein